MTIPLFHVDAFTADPFAGNAAAVCILPSWKENGWLQAVAGDEAEFHTLLADPENASLWLGEALVDRLRAAGVVLKPGECYSYVQLPILGGAYEPDNFHVYDVTTHFRVWGPIHEKIKDLPDGASIEFDVT